MTERYIPTGNEMISLPQINEATAGIESITYLSMQHKGMIEIRGSSDAPLIKPFVEINGTEFELTDISVHRDHYWIPVFKAKVGNCGLEMTVLTPIKERGFAVKLAVTGDEAADITWGLCGCWESSLHCVNENKKIEGTSHCFKSFWNDSLIFEMHCGTPMFSFAPICAQKTDASFSIDRSTVNYKLSRTDKLIPNTRKELIFYWGLGYEEVAAATSAKEILRRGWNMEYDRTSKWLDSRASLMPTPKLTEIYNQNLFFCIFYSTGITLDTEELVCATSRSSRYYVSAAYWDRDVLLWSFPAILDADTDLAKEILLYVFGRQRKNIGTHSRYIDGTVLEPGFELDELVSPVIALERYVGRTNDTLILENHNVLDGIDLILKTLRSVRHPEIALYETFLQPTDDEIEYPYLTYNNVLVRYALDALSSLYQQKYGTLSKEADSIERAIYEHCTFENSDGKVMFAWSVDLEGHHNVYDEPPGSLQLLPYYNFCRRDSQIWADTVSMIRSPGYKYSFAGYPIAEIGCDHAPYPWILSLCNSMLCGHEAQALIELELLKMDNGIACESVDPVTGVCMTGAAFATCAGFLCHSMKTATENSD